MMAQVGGTLSLFYLFLVLFGNVVNFYRFVTKFACLEPSAVNSVNSGYSR